MTYPRDRGNFIVSMIVIVDTIANKVGVRKVGSPDAYKFWKYVMEVDAGNREVFFKSETPCRCLSAGGLMG